MCLANTGNDDHQAPAITTGRRRLIWSLFKPQVRARLSRKIVPSSKINLNNYWGDFAAANHSAAVPILEIGDCCAEMRDNIINELLDAQ